tara:strand:- start:785 stop:1207 length:423 start_codon:yes stop_codon:yes gene_type:complete
MFPFLSYKREYKCIGFEDIKNIIKSGDKYVLINTLTSENQELLISNTLSISEEESIINEIISNYKVPDKPVIIYGKNCCDLSVNKKFDQLIDLGLKDVYIYYGGLFEWLLLNELYGNDEFPVNKTENIDLLRFRPAAIIS